MNRKIEVNSDDIATVLDWISEWSSALKNVPVNVAANNATIKYGMYAGHIRDAAIAVYARLHLAISSDDKRSLVEVEAWMANQLFDRESLKCTDAPSASKL